MDKKYNNLQKFAGYATDTKMWELKISTRKGGGGILCHVKCSIEQNYYQFCFD